MPAYRTTEITFVGKIGGHLWMPHAPAWKEVRKKISREDKPFSLQFPGSFKELLWAIDLDEGGDFSNHRFIDAFLVVKRVGRAAHGAISRTVYVDLNRHDTADYFWSDEEALDFMDFNDED